METTKHTMRLRAGDYERLREMYPRQGANAVIRKLVSDYVDRVDPPVELKDLED